MDSITQIKAIYSSLIEGIIPKAEEILEKIVGGQIIIDVDWDTFTDSKNELRALQVMEENVFKALIRAMHVNMDNLANNPIYEIHITNIPGGTASSKRLEFHRMKLEYHGAFEAGSAGCFTEEHLRTEIGNRGNNTKAPASPSIAASSLTSSEEMNTAERIQEFRSRRKSTVGQLKKEFQDILRAEIEEQVRTESLQDSPEALSKLVAQKEKDAEQKIRKEMFVREKKLLDYERQVEKDPKSDPKNSKIKKLEREIREKEMEIEIEERECGDDELISMMRAQLEIMKSLLVDELDAEENAGDDNLLNEEIEFSDEEDAPLPEKKDNAPHNINNNSPLPSPRRLASSNNQLSGSPAKSLSPIDIHHCSSQNDNLIEDR